MKIAPLETQKDKRLDRRKIGWLEGGKGTGNLEVTSPAVSSQRLLFTVQGASNSLRKRPETAK